jgi:3-oxoacyl-[acyl-carrier-protein] synthase II
MTGHLLGAAGRSNDRLRDGDKHGVIPLTINLDNRDPECELDYTPHVAREKRVKVALNNPFGFGGHNANLGGQRVRRIARSL